MERVAYVVDAVRTPVGRRNGSLSKAHPADLGACAVDALLRRAGVGADKAGLVDDVVFGCVTKAGAQSFNVARHVVLASALLPESVPATTVDRMCGSSQQALHAAAQAVLSGTQDVVVAGGVEVMSAVPLGADVAVPGAGDAFGSVEVQKKYGKGKSFSQFEGAELLAKQYGLTRQDLDAFGLESNRKAKAALARNAFARELAPVDIEGVDGSRVALAADECPRPNVTAEGMAKLKPLSPGGVVTAGTASQIADGASAILVCNEAGLRKLGVRPRARVVALALAATDPVTMLGGPIPATRKALAAAGLASLRDVALYEVNEAFASVPMAWAKALGADPARLNVNGGAIALGHPLGATGTKLMTTLLSALEERERPGAIGLLAICEGGGTANATLVQTLPGAKL